MSKFKSFDPTRAKKLVEEAAASIGSGEARARVKLRDRINVFWVLPIIGEMSHPVIPIKVHYKPIFHRCGRNVQFDPNNEEKLVEGGFAECSLCMGSWEVWKKDGTPGKKDPTSKAPSKLKFLEGMPAQQFACNVVQLDSFFTADSKGKYAQPDKDLVKKWGKDFVKVMKGEIEPPEGMPEDMAEAAKAGVQPLLMNEDVGRAILSEHYDAFMRDGEDPLLTPDKVLLQIKRSNKSDTFMSGGKTRHKKNYEVKFTLANLMKGWKLPEGLMDVVEDTVQDLTDPVYEGGDLREKAASLAHLTDEERQELLDLVDHTFDYGDDAEDGAEVGGPDYSDFSGGGGSSMDSDKRQKFEEMKRKMQQGDDEEDED